MSLKYKNGRQEVLAVDKGYERERGVRNTPAKTHKTEDEGDTGRTREQLT